jgi:flagellar motility protein MotE (MotC chaperone)
MAKVVRLFLIAVLTVNAAGAAALLIGMLPDAHAVSDSSEQSGAEEATLDQNALRLLGEELALRAEQLQQREAELEELLRSEEVLARAGVLENEETETAPAAEAPEEVAEPAESDNSFAFEKLQKAYENMEAESAALALAELAFIDQEAVVELLLGWKPRTSGAILDALTQTDPALAASLSYEIWKRGGKKKEQAASDGR